MAIATPGSNAPLQWAVGPTRTPTGELIGVVKAPTVNPAVQPMLAERIDIEIHGREPESRGQSVLINAAELLRDVVALQACAESAAPEEWRRSVLGAPTYPGLVLDGFEFHDDGVVYVFFDYDGMETLGLELGPDGSHSVFFA